MMRVKFKLLLRNAESKKTRETVKTREENVARPLMKSF